MIAPRASKNVISLVNLMIKNEGKIFSSKEKIPTNKCTVFFARCGLETVIWIVRSLKNGEDYGSGYQSDKIWPGQGSCRWLGTILQTLQKYFANHPYRIYPHQHRVVVYSYRPPD